MAQKTNYEPIETINLISDSDEVEDDKIFAFTEYEAFESLMDMSRNQNREIYLDNVKKLPLPLLNKNNNDAQSSSTEPDNLITSKSWHESKDKQRLSANQTYHDFLIHKQNEVARERFDEIRKMGVLFPSKKFRMGPDKDDLCKGKQVGENLYDKTVDFLINDNLSEEIVQILKEGEFNVAAGSTKKKKYVKEKSPCTGNTENTFQPNIDYLIEDNYYPGLIDDAIHQVIDFNKVAFDVFFGAGNPVPERPDMIPLSLIEAFDLRFEREECSIRNAVKTTKSVPKSNSVQNLFNTMEISGHDRNIFNRDEVVLANAIEVDLAALIKNKPMNHLTLAITCLQRAEIMNDYDKSLQAAEEAFQKAPPDLAESAAVHKADTFRTERVSKKEMTITSQNYRPIEVVSYMGITKPVIDIPNPKKSS